MNVMVVKPAYLPYDRLGEFTKIFDRTAIEDNGGNFAFVKSSPIAVNLNQKYRIPHCSLTWIDCKIETYKIA